jgi:hypothetical protein
MRVWNRSSPASERNNAQNRNDLIVVPMRNEGGHVNLLEIFGQVRLGKHLDAEAWAIKYCSIILS